MTLRFKQGEIAIFGFPATPSEAKYVGRHLTIMDVGPFKNGTSINSSAGNARVVQDFDYVTDISIWFGGFLGVHDWQLVKIGENPDAQRDEEQVEEEIEV